MLHALLKEKTRDIHQMVETHSVLNHYLSPNLSFDQYRAIVAQSYFAYSQWQKQLDNFFSSSDLDKEWHIDLHAELLSDNDLFKSSMHRDDVPSLLIDGVTDYLGCAYVFEGSKLGAKVILRKLMSNPNLKNTDFTYFKKLSCHDVSWVDWMRQLDDYVLKMEFDINRIALGAVKCFEVINKWFEIPRASFI